MIAFPLLSYFNHSQHPNDTTDSTQSTTSCGLPSCMKCRLMMRLKVTDPLSPSVSPSLFDSEIKDVLSVATAFAKDENVSSETFICSTPELGKGCKGKFALFFITLSSFITEIIY